MRRPWRRKVTALFLCVLSVAGALVVVAGPAAADNYYGDAGYRLQVKIAEIAAEWRVPAIAPGSHLGHARTFVYANWQASGVQLELGTTEDEILHDGHDVASYSAFWTSDGFGANRFHTVHAGDLVKALEIRTKIGWELTFADYTEHWQQTIKNPGVASTTINRAGWLQEDPESTVLAPAVDQTPLRVYPQMGGVTFTHLQLNDKAPQLPWSDALYIETASGIFFLPTSPRGDGFSVVPATGATRQYMADSASYNVVARAFSDLGEHWVGSTPASTRYADAQPFLASAKTFVQELSSQHWPAKVRGPIDVLASLEGQLVDLIEQLPTMGNATQASLATWVTGLLKLFTLAHAQGIQIHTLLGIPPTV